MPFDRLDIYARDGFHCRYCGYDGSTFDRFKFLELDHVDPTGPNEADNVVTCCRYCNSCKGSDPCSSVEQAREIVARHNSANLAYWELNVLPRLRRES